MTWVNGLRSGAAGFPELRYPAPSRLVWRDRGRMPESAKSYAKGFLGGSLIPEWPDVYAIFFMTWVLIQEIGGRSATFRPASQTLV